MSKYIPGNQKHLTLENRIYIENSLDKEISFTLKPFEVLVYEGGKVK